jgi:membrane protein implicated in regulation of membrane protease activity
MNTRLIIAIVTSLIDEVIIIAVVLWVLPMFDIHLPVWGLVLLIIAFMIYAVMSFKIGSRILKKKPLPGMTSMVGIEGRVTTSLVPRGFVKIESELWKARAESGSIISGTIVTVISQDGLELVVRKK